jgi:protein translocase SecG subunit
MTILIILFTILLILDCLLLSLLVLVQLPKKDAGVGMAFGGGTADALFGAGSGTALSSLTKYTAGAFFILVFVLSLLNNHVQHANSAELRNQFNKLPATSAPAAPAASAAPVSNTSPAIPLTITTNVTTATSMTNPPAKK